MNYLKFFTMKKGHRFSEESKRKMSESRRRYLGVRGGTLPSTYKTKIAKGLARYFATMTPEQKRKRAEACKRGANKESRRKEMSERFKRLWKDPEWVAKRKRQEFKGRSKEEDSLFQWVCSVSDKQVERHWKGLPDLVGPRAELDIYIPEIKLAIEYNGSYWHNKKNVKDTDEKKRQICSESGIRLIVVTENDWGKYEWSEERQRTQKKILDAIKSPSGLLGFIQS